MNPKVFLKAEWRNLLMANYAVDPAILKQYVPTGTEIDYWKGNAYVSLVGFMFRQVRVRGIMVPFHVNFPEVNLRFYVRFKQKNEWKRGVVFINEIVPKPAISFIANNFFKEKYITLPMVHQSKNHADGILEVRYSWRKGKAWNHIAAKAESKALPLIKGSKEEFITEHFWGYTRIDEKRTGEYNVSHPRWNIHLVKEFDVNCSFGKVYGNGFGVLDSIKPSSVFLAEGSAIEVFTKKVL